MKKTIKKFYQIITFQIGVNVIGLPDFTNHLKITKQWVIYKNCKY